MGGVVGGFYELRDGCGAEGVSCEGDLAGCVDVHYVFEWCQGGRGGIEIVQLLAEIQLQETVMDCTELPKSDLQLRISSSFYLR